MTERFNVSGALLVKLFGRPEQEDQAFRDTRRPGARHRGHLGDVRPGVLRRADHRRRARDGPGVRRRRLAGCERRPSGRDRRRAGDAAHPALRPAHRAVQRPGRRDDRAGLLRAGLRGARPRADGRRDARTRSTLPPAGARRRRSRTCTSATPRADEVSLASLESVAVLDSTEPQQVLHGISLHRRGRHADRAGRPVRRRQDDHLPAADPDVRRAGGRHPGRRAGRARRHAAVPARRRRGRDPGRPHVPRLDPREPALRPTRTPPRTSSGQPWRPPRSRTWCAPCPTGSTPSSATAATGCRAGRSSGWPSPGCCSRRQGWWSSTRRRRTSTASRRRRCSGRCRQRSQGRTSVVIAHRLSTVRRRRPDPGHRGRPGRRARARSRRAARRGRPVRRALPHPVRAADRA